MRRLLISLSLIVALVYPKSGWATDVFYPGAPSAGGGGTLVTTGGNTCAAQFTAAPSGSVCLQSDINALYACEIGPCSGTNAWQAYINSGALAVTDINTCSKVATIWGVEKTGNCGAVVLSASPTITGTVGGTATAAGWTVGNATNAVTAGTTTGNAATATLATTATTANNVAANGIDATTDFSAGICPAGNILERGGTVWSCITTPVSGSTNAANVGTGEGLVFRDKISTTLNFKRLLAGTNVTITNGADDITIAAAGGGGTLAGDVDGPAGANVLDTTSTRDPLELVLRLPQLQGTLTVGKGGTGATTLTSNGILLGNGTGAVGALAALTDGQIPIGRTGNTPLPATISGTPGRITMTPAAGAITLDIPTNPSITLGSNATGTAANVTAGNATSAAVALTGDDASSFFAGAGFLEPSKGGTGGTPGADNQMLFSTGPNTAGWQLIGGLTAGACDPTTGKLIFDGATLQCGVDAGASGSPTNITAITDTGDVCAAGTVVRQNLANGAFECVATTGTTSTLLMYSTSPTITTPVLSGTVTGTYNLAGTPTISSPTISSAVMTTTLTIPTAAALNPAASGVIAYDTTTANFKYGDAGTTRVVANLDETQTLSAKTLSAPILSGKLDGAGSVSNDNDCTGDQSNMWWDIGSLTWKICNLDTGTPLTLGGSSSSDPLLLNERASYTTDPAADNIAVVALEPFPISEAPNLIIREQGSDSNYYNYNIPTIFNVAGVVGGQLMYWGTSGEPSINPASGLTTDGSYLKSTTHIDIGADPADTTGQLRLGNNDRICWEGVGGTGVDKCFYRETTGNFQLEGTATVVGNLTVNQGDFQIDNAVAFPQMQFKRGVHNAILSAQSSATDNISWGVSVNSGAASRIGMLNIDTVSGASKVWMGSTPEFTYKPVTNGLSVDENGLMEKIGSGGVAVAALQEASTTCNAGDSVKTNDGSAFTCVATPRFLFDGTRWCIDVTPFNGICDSGDIDLSTNAVPYGTPPTGMGNQTVQGNLIVVGATTISGPPVVGGSSPSGTGQALVTTSSSAAAYTGAPTFSGAVTATSFTAGPHATDGGALTLTEGVDDGTATWKVKVPDTGGLTGNTAYTCQLDVGGTLPGSCLTGSTVGSPLKIIDQGAVTLTIASLAGTGTTCETEVVTSASVLSTDVVSWTPNGDISALTGWTPATSMIIYPYPGSGNITFKVCNPSTTTAVDPADITLNWRVSR